MEVRTHDWLDKKTLTPYYGIQVKHDSVWMHFSDYTGVAFLYKNKTDRDKRLISISRQNNTRPDKVLKNKTGTVFIGLFYGFGRAGEFNGK